MSTLGWIFMLVSVIGISVLFFWAVWRVMRAPDNRVHGGLEIDPDDREE
jgi:hypothetical protein